MLVSSTAAHSVAWEHYLITSTSLITFAGLLALRRGVPRVKHPGRAVRSGPQVREGYQTQLQHADDGLAQTHGALVKVCFAAFARPSCACSMLLILPDCTCASLFPYITSLYHNLIKNHTMPTTSQGHGRVEFRLAVVQDQHPLLSGGNVDLQEGRPQRLRLHYALRLRQGTSV